MSGPVRIQRKRVKGYDMQAESLSINGLPCVYVGRPTKWGNPFVVNRFVGLETTIALFRDSMHGCWSPSTVEHLSDEWARHQHKCHHAFMARMKPHPLDCVTELRGKNLSCFCPLDQPCHADVLLELANQDPDNQS